MKKLAMILALLLSLSAFFGLAGAETVDNPTSAFVGRWADPVYGRASLRILHAEEEDAPDYDIQILWGNSADSMGVWSMTARWDAEAGKLAYEDGVMSIVTADDDGEGGEEVLYDDAVGAFWFDEDGVLRWEDSREDRAEEFRLERVVSVAPSAEDLVAAYFRPVADVESGTAGSSLKQAAAAHDVMRFAYMSDVWNVDVSDLRESLLAAWLSLDDDTRARFDENFLDRIAARVSGAFSDYASDEGLFEDAGVGEDMAFLVGDIEARLSWETLLANTLTIGNSEG